MVKIAYSLCMKVQIHLQTILPKYKNKGKFSPEYLQNEEIHTIKSTQQNMFREEYAAQKSENSLPEKTSFSIYNQS